MGGHSKPNAELDDAIRSSLGTRDLGPAAAAPRWPRRSFSVSRACTHGTDDSRSLVNRNHRPPPLSTYNGPTLGYLHSVESKRTRRLFCAANCAILASLSSSAARINDRTTCGQTPILATIVDIGAANFERAGACSGEWHGLAVRHSAEEKFVSEPPPAHAARRRRRHRPGAGYHGWLRVAKTDRSSHHPSLTATPS